MTEYLKLNRKRFFESLDDNSIAILHSGYEKFKSADATYDFFINNNFYYYFRQYISPTRALPESGKNFS